LPRPEHFHFGALPVGAGGRAIRRPIVVGVKAEEHLEGATAFVGDVDERIAGERVISQDGR